MIQVDLTHSLPADYPYDSIDEAQDWWRSVDLPEDQKQLVARGNAIRLFKLPLDP